jgi:hypothetical protein
MGDLMDDFVGLYGEMVEASDETVTEVVYEAD